MTDMMTLEELAAKLKVPKSWIYNRTRPSAKDPIPCHKIGKYLRFIPSEVECHLGIRMPVQEAETA